MYDLKRKRLVAFIIDINIAALLSIVLAIILIVTYKHLAISIAGSFFYIMLICKDCYNGMSIGRYFMKIQVFNSKTQHVASPTKCIIRNCFFLLGIVELLLFLCSSSGLRVGDFITNTKVDQKVDECQKVNIRKVIVSVMVFALLFSTPYIIIYLFRDQSSLLQLLSLLWY